jgi:hypothetical protein
MTSPMAMAALALRTATASATTLYESGLIDACSLASIVSIAHANFQDAVAAIVEEVFAV